MCDVDLGRVVEGVATLGLSEVARGVGADSETVSRVVKGFATGGASEVSRATGLPADPLSVGKELERTARKNLKPKTPEPAPSTAPSPQLSKDPLNPGVTGALQKRVRRLGSGKSQSKTLLTGGNLTDDVFNLSSRSFFE